MERTDVAVVGAGAAGLAAADALRREGLGVIVLEARDRIGGRVLTLRDDRVPVPIELGAEFVHGEAPETNRLLREAGQAVLDLAGEPWQRKGGRLQPATEYWRQVDRVLAHAGEEGSDLSLDDWLARKPGGPSLARGRTLARRFVQGFHAADTARVSVRSIASGGEAPTASARCSGRVAGGYDRVIQWLARTFQGGEAHGMRLRSPVAEISWEKGGAELEVRPLEAHPEGAAPYRLAARAVVVTAPLGVLQVPAGEPGSLGFRPELPPRIRRALSRLAMGPVVRVPFWFREAPWEEKLPGLPAGRDLARLGFLHIADAAINVWWTAYPVRAPLAVAWSGGPPAAALLAQGTDALADHALRTLAETLGLTRRRLRSQTEAFWMHDWQADPWSRGAYSYALVGGATAARELAKPVDGTLFLAGEAMDAEGRNGTVEGAIASGLRAAGLAKRALARSAR